MIIIFVILNNYRSLEGVLDELRSDQLVDGVSINNVAGKGKLNLGLASIDHSDDEHNATSALPGTNGGRGKNDGSRNTRADIHTSAVSFSSTGHEWAAATTQGLQVFKDHCINIFSRFDQFLYVCNRFLA